MENKEKRVVHHIVKPKVCTAKTVVFIQTNQERYKRRNLHRLLNIHNNYDSVKIVFLLNNIEPLGRYKHENRVFDDIIIANYSISNIWNEGNKEPNLRLLSALQVGCLQGFHNGTSISIYHLV